ncbi:hypothetical protein NHX12_030479 [Muraenolepis orangiensis]|uniref:SCA7 domain-containing protein n=1 Tax=Muraenolepis orangiensis TaxID=630683 RepID=A0A9Q0E8Q5_9TELE|nr:hypothetical protein NHX12_030479 [Muraenolepis orangiensis]
MATVAERRSLPSPEIVPGQPWSRWVDASKLHGDDGGADSEESLKDLGRNREAMRLCREDMPIFGQCPAQDDFYLVMCSHCSQVVKPQAFQAHYERRHSLASKPTAILGRSSAVGPSVVSSNSKLLKPAKDKRKAPYLPFRVLQPDKILIPAVKVEKIHLKPPPPAPGHIPNGKGHASVLSEKKQEGGGASSRRHIYKRLSEREFNPDVHCGVVDMTARKPCTRSLTCKTHSLSQRRAVSGRRKRFDTLLAEHKSRTSRDQEREPHAPHSQQTTPPLREPHPSSRLAAVVAHDPHQAVLPGKRRQSLLNSSHGPGVSPTEPAAGVHDGPHQPQNAPDGVSRPSSDEGENEGGEENADRLDCHYSGSHPRPAAYCTFGSRLSGRGSYTFDRRWDRMRCSLSAMMDKHVNSQMWKKIPLALENSSSSAVAPAHGTSTTPHGSTSSSSSGLLNPPPSGTQLPYGQSYEGRPVLSYGTALNARACPQSGADHPAYGTTQARQVSLGGANSTGSFSSGKKRKNSSFLAPPHGPSSDSSSSSNANYSSSFKKNCANAQGSSGSTSSHHHGSTAPASSSSHSGVHSMGLNCGPTVRTNSLSLKAEPGGGPGGSSSGPSPRGPPSGSPAESIKRMSVVMNSKLHHAGFGHHASDGRLDGKKRKSSPASGGGGLGVPGGGGGGGHGRPKVAKSPSINNIHGKHGGRSVAGGPGLPNNSHLHQPKARP